MHMRLSKSLMFSLVVLAMLPVGANAQDEVPVTAAAAEHHWLQRLVGDWTVEATMLMGPDRVEHTSGTESVSALGGLWTVGDMRGPMPGGGVMHSIMQLGYDTQRQTFVGTFIASVMTHLWVYERGWLNEDGSALTLEATGPSFTDPNAQSLYRDIIEFVTNDHRILRSQVQTEDGEWFEFLEAHFYRQ